MSMLDFLKRSYRLIAPISGRVMNITEVPDEIFANKMAGDGLAIEPTGDVVVAPADGTLSLIFRTNHAFGMVLDNGIEILIHIGLDTIALNGRGFERIAQEGQRVKTGDPIIKLDRELILNNECTLITPVLITNVDNIKYIEVNEGSLVEAGKDMIMEYKLK